MIKCCLFLLIVGGTSFYVHHTESKTWYEARASCQRADSDLAIFRSAEEQKAVTDKIKDLSNINNWWIGIHRSTTLSWVDGSVIKWTNWKDDEPNNSGNCGYLRRSGWNWGDTQCSTVKSYICGVGKSCIIYFIFVI